ncbi:hypothetical protein BCR34DRAFT_160015 [Clohesyomyces aquaticus]|uniref:DUF7492 domain-containing protein n=1 Tax=Clohesyomyces aquaticus TaxID=1231657 RepID=A0A1Y1YID4_9PLEO|nr:hypothetical protein BCR34DRAFT_160015 [Clohesyomyces aquaticus]
MVCLTSILVGCAVITAVNGHTWIEQLRNIDKDGKYSGEYGYPRGYVAKTDPGYNSETDMNYQLPTEQQQPPFIDATNLLCHPNQRKPTQSKDKYPRLQAVPGGFMALRYMENGHVTLADPNGNIGRPEKGGTIYVYGTTQPLEDEKLVDVLQWKQDGSGGDKRGVLLATNNFDDGRCYEISDFALAKERMAEFPNYAMGQAPRANATGQKGNFPLFCESNVALPKDAATGKPYTLYWVWQWPVAPGATPIFPKGKDQYYTTCMDVDVVDTIKQDAQAKFPLVQQDATSLAVSDFASRTAILTDAVKGELGPVFQSGPTASRGSPSATQPAAQPTITGPSNTSAIFSIHTLSSRPGAQPTRQPNGLVTITVTEHITVTAPGVVATVTATRRPNQSHFRRNGAKFRSRTLSE